MQPPTNPHVQNALANAPPIDGTSAFEAQGKSAADDAPDSISELVARQKRRLRYEFTIPVSAKTRDTDPSKFELFELSDREEELASKAAGGDRRKTLVEMVKLSLASVDGKPIDNNEEEATFYWEQRFGSKVRKLVQIAFNSLHITDDKEDEDFLASRRVKVGSK